MFTVTVKDHVMIAHSLPDPYFGPAANMHGATYIVEATFKSNRLNDKNVVIDIGEASELVKTVLSELAYKNLDELPQFKGILTTTEYLAKHIHDNIRKSLKEPLGLRIELLESHVASAAYESFQS